MIKRLTSFLIVTIFLFCITCCKVNISEEKNPFMPVIVPEMVKVSGGIINGKNNSLVRIVVIICFSIKLDPARLQLNMHENRQRT